MACNSYSMKTLFPTRASAAGLQYMPDDVFYLMIRVCIQLQGFPTFSMNFGTSGITGTFVKHFLNWQY